jgi:hypothetical protein
MGRSDGFDLIETPPNGESQGETLEAASNSRPVRELHRIRHSFEGGALANLAHKLVDAGQLVEAAAVAERSVTRASEAGDDWALADARYAVGRAAGELGDPAAAVEALSASLQLLRRLETSSMVADVTRELCRWQLDR